jgi:hypothetical protein
MANRRKFEDIVDDLRHGRIDPDDAADELEEGYGKSVLREQAGKLPELETRIAELEDENKSLKLAPAREKAFRDFGVDFEHLGALGREKLEQYKDELETEKIAQFVERWELPLAQAGGQQGGTGQELPNAAAVAAAARGAPAGGRPGQGGPTLSPKEVASWPQDKRTRLIDEHPAEYERLMKGETLVGFTFD